MEVSGGDYWPSCCSDVITPNEDEVKHINTPDISRLTLDYHFDVVMNERCKGVVPVPIVNYAFVWFISVVVLWGELLIFLSIYFTLPFIKKDYEKTPKNNKYIFT